MLRSILSESRKAFVLTNLKSKYCSKPTTFPEVNQVTLVGTLINDAFTFQSGTKSLRIRTYNASGKKYQYHHVHTRGSNVIKAGQRVHVSGKLRSIPFEIENQKKREQTSVMAYRIFVFDNNRDDSKNTAMVDINRIRIVANVAFVVKFTGSVHIFRIATHFEHRTDDGLVNGTNFHEVFVFDEHLKKNSENLKTGDKVAIQGELRSRTHTLSDGKKKYSGFIVAKRMEKVQREAQ